MRRRTHGSAPPSPTAQGFHHHPFRQLAGRLGKRGAQALPHNAPDKPEAEQVETVADDEELFRREMSSVRPLSARERQRVPQPPVPQTVRLISDPDAEALAELSDLVAGNGPFDIAHTTEFIEGAVLGLDPRLIRRLRNGEFSYQSHLDLHGMTASEARSAVEAFLNDAHRRGQRCVLIVHGRGLNSKDQVPVLKHRLASWFSRSSFARLVLAFTSARPCDGGAGALYVLLRRKRQAKQPIRVTEGAKW
jgi:DNA-nicking Smr family endonuclease